MPRVKAAPGTRVPREGKPRDYIDDQQFVEVPDTQYYRRRLRDKSLTEEPAAVEKPARKKAGEEA